MENEQIQTLLTYLSTSFPNQFEYPTGDPKEDKRIITVWEDWVGDYGFKEAKRAVKKAMEGRDYIPSPAKVAYWLDDSLTPEEAWEIYNGKEAPGLSDRAKELIERAGSAVEYSKSDRKVGERKYIRKQFIEQFRAISKRDWQEQALPSTKTPFQLPEEGSDAGRLQDGA